MTEHVCPECGFKTTILLLIGVHREYVHGIKRHDTSTAVLKTAKTAPTMSGAKRQARTEMMGPLRAETSVPRDASVAAHVAESQQGAATVGSIDVIQSEVETAAVCRPGGRVRVTKCDDKEATQPAAKKAAVLSSRTSTWKCLACPFVTYRRRRFEEHSARHELTDNDELKCRECTYVASAPIGLLAHSVVHEVNYVGQTRTSTNVKSLSKHSSSGKSGLTTVTTEPSVDVFKSKESRLTNTKHFFPSRSAPPLTYATTGDQQQSSSSSE